MFTGGQEIMASKSEEGIKIILTIVTTGWSIFIYGLIKLTIYKFKEGRDSEE